MDVPTEFLTARLRLRAPTLEDAHAIFDAYASDPEVPRYLTWRPHTSVVETRNILQFCIDEWARQSSFAYVIELTTDPGRPIGAIHVHAGGNHGIGFGYVLARAHWNKGYMSEALTALVDWWLAQKGIFRCFAMCDAEHAASARVMEKAGLAFEGVFRRYAVHPNISDEPRDALVYAKVR